MRILYGLCDKSVPLYLCRYKFSYLKEVYLRGIYGDFLSCRIKVLSSLNSYSCFSKTQKLAFLFLFYILGLLFFCPHHVAFYLPHPGREAYKPPGNSILFPFYKRTKFINSKKTKIRDCIVIAWCLPNKHSDIYETGKLYLSFLPREHFEMIRIKLKKFTSKTVDGGSKN